MVKKGKGSGFYCMETGFFRIGKEKLQMLKNRNYDEDSIDFNGDWNPYEDADIFLSGSCQLFALELHNRYGYQGLNLQTPANKNCHFFCTTTVGGKTVYIDVRGITDNIEKLIAGYAVNGYKIVEYNFEDEKNLSAADMHGVAFAKQIIDDNEGYYNIKKL